MKTIKVIDLLNKIANGEEVPKRIDYGGLIEGYEYLLNNIKRFSLNDEVEIIEDTLKEDKKIEYIDYLTFNDFSNENKVWYLENKVNEIIDKVNGE